MTQPSQQIQPESINTNTHEIQISNTIMQTNPNKNLNDQLQQQQSNVQFSKLAQQVSTKTAHPSYRADIDGLRTIAISIVVIFHAFPQFMTGGFIGVDVFFVISGYLISGIIIKQSLKNKFSYKDFYIRRIKRIYPALLTVLIFVLSMVLLIYTQRRQKIATKTMTASTIFIANIEVLTNQKGYFDPGVKQNPLLHLWSLGVEEQFYIIWPCVITLLLARFKSITTILLGAFTIGSFAFGILTVYQNPKFAFYFPVCRFWQMSIGGLIAYKSLIINKKIWNDLLSIFGTLSILITIWILNQNSLFPGWWALIPTLGSASILLAGPDAFVNKHILSTKIFVFIGKISYPLYLWHWPLLVFSRFLFPKGSTSIFGNIFFVILLAIGLSTLTYYFIQNKLRFRKSILVVWILIVCMVLISLCSLSIFLFKKQQLPQFIDFDSPINPISGQEVNFLKEYHNALIPTKQDFYINSKGKKLPNSSINKKRSSTSVQKVKAARVFMQYDEFFTNRLFLDKLITKQSKYYEQNTPKLRVFEVSNQGNQQQLFLVGDSHAKFLTWRLQYLYQQSVKNNKTSQFPTIVALIKQNVAYYQWNNPDFIHFAQTFIKKHKPRRVLFSHRWVGYWKMCLDCRDIQLWSQQHYQLINTQFQGFLKLMKQLVDEGIQVSVVTLHIQNDNCDPKNMYDFLGVIQQNIKPIKLSQFRKQFKGIIDIFEPRLQAIGVKLVHLSDNHCWQDQCELLSPSGYSIFIDDNHYGKFYSRYWASAIDHLVEFNEQ